MENTKNKKEVIDNKEDYDAFTQVMTAKAFFNKYSLSMGLVAELAAGKGMVYAEFTDRPLNDNEKTGMKDYLQDGGY